MGGHLGLCDFLTMLLVFGMILVEGKRVGIWGTGFAGRIYGMAQHFSDGDSGL